MMSIRFSCAEPSRKLRRLFAAGGQELIPADLYKSWNLTKNIVTWRNWSHYPVRLNGITSMTPGAIRVNG